MKKNKLVSIIITTKNEADVIEELIKSCLSQSYKKIEVIVVDNHSTDETKKIIKNLSVNFYTLGPERSAQRNFGAKKSKGEFLFFVDADMVLSKNVVRECVERMSKKDIGGIIIPELSVSQTFWGSIKAYERSFYNKDGDEVTDAARFFRGKVFDAIGGYDLGITGPEDWDFPERVKEKGYKLARIKSHILHKERIKSPIELAKKKYYYALNLNKYLKKHNIAAFSPKTVYFLRPVFYRQWKKIISHPGLSLAMFLMLSLELFGGGLGFVAGRFRNE